MIEKCEDCKAWDNGFCRRYPPVPLVSKGLVYAWSWPKSDHKDWCMEFIHRPKKEGKK